MRQSENEAAKPVFRGSIDDWELLYYVWVDEAGRIERDARRRLVRYRELRMYDKEGHRRKSREIVNCRFGIALRCYARQHNRVPGYCPLSAGFLLEQS
jgi:hypothetical protein